MLENIQLEDINELEGAIDVVLDVQFHELKQKTIQHLEAPNVYVTIQSDGSRLFSLIDNGYAHIHFSFTDEEKNTINSFIDKLIQKGENQLSQTA